MTDTIEIDTQNNNTKTPKVNENDSLTDFVNDCMIRVDELLQSQKITPISKKRFPVDGGTIGIVYQLGHFGVEITVHKFIIFSQYNSRYLEVLDYKTAEAMTDYALPIIQNYIDDPAITKHIFVRQINKIKSMFSFNK